MRLLIPTRIQCPVHGTRVCLYKRTNHSVIGGIFPDPSLPARPFPTTFGFPTFAVGCVSQGQQRCPLLDLFELQWKLLLITKHSLDVFHYQCRGIAKIALSLFQPLSCLVLVYHLFGLFLFCFVYNSLCNNLILSFHIVTTKLIFFSFTTDF